MVANGRESSEDRRRGEDASTCSKAPRDALTVFTEKADPSLVTQGWVGDKPCLVTLDTGEYGTVARADIAAGWPEMQPSPSFTLQTVSGEALPILKEAFPTLTPGTAPIENLGFRRGHHQ
jgi:hypothetical protein